MEIDPTETTAAGDDDQRTLDAAARRLNSFVAITVALLATFLGICKVKDDNIVQAMQQAQADRLDHWNFYQARNIREEVAKAALAEFTVAEEQAPASERERFHRLAAEYQRLVDEQASKKNELEAQANADQQHYDALNYRDDQFDLSDALGALAVSLLAVTALTHKRWLYIIALVPTGLCVVMGVAALAGWPLHPDQIVKLLS